MTESNCFINLPIEIIELIFNYCNCTTLKLLKSVHKDWIPLIESLIKKRCLQNIPDFNLLEYKYKHNNNEQSLNPKLLNQITLENICENWENWQDIEKNIQFENISFIYEKKYISCVSVFQNYIAIGLDTGSVNLFNQNEKLLKCYEPLVEREPQTIHFVPAYSDISTKDEPIALLVEYTQITGIHDFTQNLNPEIFEHQLVFAAYKQYICGVALNGTVTIAQINYEPNNKNNIVNKCAINQTKTLMENQKMSFVILKLLQLQVPNTNNRFVSLSQTKCTVLSDDKVLVINYNDENNNIEGTADVIASLDFAMNSVPVLWRDALMFYDQVIITNSQPRADTGQIFEVFLLDTNITSKTNQQNQIIPSVKTFYLSDVFESLITCVYLYGNTLVLGFANGEILFYVITNFEKFDLKNYSKRITMSAKLGRILSIDVIESYKQREFYIAGPTFVRKITGKSL